MSEPVVPDHGGACLTGVVPAILDRHDARLPAWVPAPLAGARQAVLLVIDGLGWEQLRARPQLTPNLTAMTGGPVTTVAPSTTAAALTSLTTGAPPTMHGIVGYRMAIAPDEVLNVLRWSTPAGDARDRFRPEAVQPLEVFGGTKPPVVTRASFEETGFSQAHLAGSEQHGWRYASTLVVRVAQLVREGRDFVYAYYPGVDTVAHEFGFGDLYDAEVAAADGLAGDLLAALPAGTALAVVADHGQVDVGERVIPLDPGLGELVRLLSGEGRFRWLHARPGAQDRLLEAATALYGDVAWVRSRDQVIGDGWLGGTPSATVAARLGDVALVARTPVAFVDPAESGAYDLVCRHGSMTSAEMLVPFVAARA